ncbi:hypothetical protein [Methylobacterium sp. JK268]
MRAHRWTNVIAYMSMDETIDRIDALGISPCDVEIIGETYRLLAYNSWRRALYDRLKIAGADAQVVAYAGWTVIIAPAENVSSDLSPTWQGPITGALMHPAAHAIWEAWQ